MSAKNAICNWQIVNLILVDNFWQCQWSLISRVTKGEAKRYCLNEITLVIVLLLNERTPISGSYPALSGTILVQWYAIRSLLCIAIHVEHTACHSCSRIRCWTHQYQSLLHCMNHLWALRARSSSRPCHRCRDPGAGCRRRRKSRLGRSCTGGRGTSSGLALKWGHCLYIIYKLYLFNCDELYFSNFYWGKISLKQ